MAGFRSLGTQPDHEYDTFIDKGKGYDPGPGYKQSRSTLCMPSNMMGDTSQGSLQEATLQTHPSTRCTPALYPSEELGCSPILRSTMDWKYGRWTSAMHTLRRSPRRRCTSLPDRSLDPLEGHTLLINKAIYGLKSSGLRWSERFSDVLSIWDSFYQRQKRISGCVRRTEHMNTLEST
jgi:hypothetical protein